MIATLSAVFVASLLGSPHCAGMCGAFCTVAVAPPRPVTVGLTVERRPATGRGRMGLLAAYNGGRLVTYAGLGAVAGAVGAAVDLGASLVGIQRAAMVLAGAVILTVGLVSLLRSLNVPIPRAPLPGFARRVLVAAHRAADRLPPPMRALSIGLLTTLLPCGWLWAFVITAAGSASPLMGAMVMGAFWLGTAPIMLALGAGVQTVALRLGAKLPVLTSILLMGVGTYAVAGRLAAPEITLPSTKQNASVGPAVVPDPGHQHCPLCTSREP